VQGAISGSLGCGRGPPVNPNVAVVLLGAAFLAASLTSLLLFRLLHQQLLGSCALWQPQGIDPWSWRGQVRADTSLTYADMPLVPICCYARSSAVCSICTTVAAPGCVWPLLLVCMMHSTVRNTWRGFGCASPSRGRALSAEC
jgi:hypothetical protein